MKQFDVLSGATKISQSYLIEASAGTGKTFSIENIVVRLLIEEGEYQAPLAIEDIVVVTFTRAATRELRARVRKNIEQIHQVLVHYFDSGYLDEQAYDYVRKVCALGTEAVRKAKRRLARALADYDDAQIYTIHGFCYRSLLEHAFESDITEGAFNEEHAVSPARILQAIKDYFRTEVSAKKYSPFQLELLLRKHQHDLDFLAKSLMRSAMRGLKIKGGSSFEASLEKFNAAIENLKKEHAWTAEGLQADFELIGQQYKQVLAKSEADKNRDAFARIARCFCAAPLDDKQFERILKDQLRPLHYFQEGNLKKTAKLPTRDQLRHPGAIEILKGSLMEIIQAASSYLWIYGRMAEEIRCFVQRVFHEEEVFTPDDILTCMFAAVEKTAFVDAMRKRYQAVIVDEFQDTDPIQWGIISKLFLPEEKKWGALYLVGDPKQSIYGFRRADIYTYMQAAKELGSEAQATLTTNFRSQGSLIRALNALLDQEKVPDLIHLPKTQENIPCIQVNIPEGAEGKLFKDEGAALQFFAAEGGIGRGKTWPSEAIFEEQLFPFITQEIQRLHKDDGLAWSQFAVLVRDRFEAENLQKFLKTWNVPSTAKRSSSLVDSPIFTAFFDLIYAAIHPFSHTAVVKVLAGILIAWDHDKLKDFTEGEGADLVQEKLESLRRCLFKDGIVSFYQTFLRMCWHDSKRCFFEECMSRDNGLKVHLLMEQIVEIIAEEECRVPNSPEGVLSQFDHIKQMHENDDHRIKLRQSGEDAVSILTLHISKGLEFDVVFALGLAKRTSDREDLIPSQEDGEDILLACTRDSKEALAFSKELDAEKMRQFYVGVTRAKYRLYLPLVIEKEDKYITPGTASPMELYLEKLSLKSIEDLNDLSDCVSLRWIPEAGYPLKAVKDEIKKALDTKIENFPIPGKSIFVRSFSSLFQGERHGFSGRVPPKDWDAEMKTPLSIPAGADTGVLLHSLFETFPYQSMGTIESKEDIEVLIKPHLKINKLPWAGAFSDLMYQTFFTALNTGKQSFCLADVEAGYMWHEMEFLYPMDENLPFDPGEGLLKGFIDLIFMHDGLYYLLDWKSNWLGENYEDYQREYLAQAMNEHLYFRQAEIYTSALERYLKIVEQRPFSECFGGTFYLFVRGMKIDLGSDTGVYYIPPVLSKKELVK